MSAKFTTHYDTLKVTQDAPEEVISAAYKALARLYHPDRAGTDPEAVLAMQNVNIAYGILSDKQKRAAHDEWINKQERRNGVQDNSVRQKPTSAAAAQSEKAMAEAKKWAAWAQKTELEAKEAQERADKAKASLEASSPADRAKWEAWYAKTAQEARETRERADKAAAQAASALGDIASAAQGTI